MQPAPGWLVLLAGHDFDLRLWERSLKPPYDPCCEWIRNGENLMFSIRSRLFVLAQSAEEVRERAIPLIAWLYGALAVVAGAEPLNFHSVLRIDDQGGLSFSVFMEDDIKVRDAIEIAEVRDAHGNLIQPPPSEPSAAQKWVEAAEQDDDIADMLIFAGRADNWFDIYKAIELAERLSGGQHELRVLLGDTRAKFKDIRETANFYRHARTHRPAVLADLADAKPLLSVIVRTVLARKVG